MFGHRVAYIGNGDAESGCRDKGLEVAIACDKCRMVVKAILSDEGIGQIGSTTGSEHFCSEESGTFPKAFCNGERRKFKNRPSQGL